MELRSVLLACSPLLLLPGPIATAQTLDERRAEIKERWLGAVDDEDRTQSDDEDAASDDGSADDDDAADDAADDDATADDEASADDEDAAGDTALIDDDDAIVDQDSRDELREDLRRRLDGDD